MGKCLNIENMGDVKRKAGVRLGRRRGSRRYAPTVQWSVSIDMKPLWAEQNSLSDGVPMSPVGETGCISRVVIGFADL